MHRVGRDKNSILKTHQCKISPNDTVILIFGEIDVRCHVKKIAQRFGISPTEVIDNLANRYFNAIDECFGKYNLKNMIICEIMPPSIHPKLKYFDEVPEGDVTKLGYPAIGTFDERLEYRRLLNTAMEARCAKRNYKFFKYDHLITNEKGALIPELSDANVHLAQKHHYLIHRELRKIL